MKFLSRVVVEVFGWKIGHVCKPTLYVTPTATRLSLTHLERARVFDTF